MDGGGVGDDSGGPWAVHRPIVFQGGYVGQVYLFAGNFPPAGSAFAHGQLRG